MKKIILFCWIPLLLSSCTLPEYSENIVNPMDCSDALCIEEYIKNTSDEWLRNCVVANIWEHPQISEKMNNNGIFTEEEKAGIDALYKECLHYKEVENQTNSGSTSTGSSSKDSYPIFTSFITSAAWAFVWGYIANELLTHTRWDYRHVNSKNIDSYYSTGKNYKEEDKSSSGSTHKWSYYHYPYYLHHSSQQDLDSSKKNGLTEVSKTYNKNSFEISKTKSASDLSSTSSKYSLWNTGKSWSAISNSYKWGSHSSSSSSSRGSSSLG